MPEPDSREYWSAIAVVAEQDLLVAESISGIAQHVESDVDIGLFLFRSKHPQLCAEVDWLCVFVVAAWYDEILAADYFYLLAVGGQRAEVIGL